ncbi:hypothetical protein QEN19_001408 [Hanseniaspora menglaensis]
MFPGNQKLTYNNANTAASTNGYQRPSVPPPVSSINYSQRPSVPPPVSSINQAQRPSAPPPNANLQQYSRPSMAPSTGSNQYQSSTYSFSLNNDTSKENPNDHFQTQPYLQHLPSQQTFGQSRMPRRKALLIGINYFNTSNELKGCISDALRVNQFLTSKCGYSQDDVVILRDDVRDNLRVIPTRQNIINAMIWLVRDAIPGDCLFMSYSGHGTQVADQDGDEMDGMDDCICPVDFQQGGMLIDDVIHDIMVKPLPQGCRLTALMDCCHSGSVLDLPFTYSTKGVIKTGEGQMYKDLGTEGLSLLMNYAMGSKSNMMSGAMGLFKTVQNGGGKLTKEQQQRVIQMKQSPADVISISGCKDNQTSADTSVNSTNTGALTWAFLEVLSENPNQSYLTLLNSIRDKLAGKYSQKPQLACSHELDCNLQFIF